MDFIKTICDNCNNTVSSPKDQLGEIRNCPYCKNLLRVEDNTKNACNVNFFDTNDIDDFDLHQKMPEKRKNYITIDTTAPPQTIKPQGPLG